MGELRCPAEMGRLHEMLEFVVAGARTCGLGDEAVHWVDLAAEEALANVVHHAYPGGQGEICVGWEQVTFEGRPALVVTVVDRGVPFNPLERPEPNLAAPIEDRPIGGLGIVLVKQSMDCVAYERRGDENVLTLVKWTG